MSGTITHAQRDTDRAEILILEEPQQQRFPVCIAQIGHCLIHDGSDAVPIGRCLGSGVEVFHNMPCVHLPAAFIAQKGQSCVTRPAVKPPHERSILPHFADQRQCFAGEVREDALGDLTRQLGRSDLPPRSGTNEVGVPGDDFAERRFRPLFGVFPKKLRIGLRLHLTYYTAAPGEIRQGT